MKKIEMQHPKLYLSAIKNKNSQIEFTYISNKFSATGDLKEELIILDSIDTDAPIESALIHLNKIELKKLDIFISRQKKVVSNYKSKGKSEKLRIVCDSLELFTDLQSKFNKWFDKMECTV